MPLTARRRFAVRFSLGALLFITLCVCGYFAGYRRGFTAGERDRSAATIYIQAYSVADLIVPVGEPDTPPARRAAGDLLIDMIVDHVEPRSWKESGSGDGEIQWFESNESLMISQSQEGHDKIAALLARLRAHPEALTAHRPSHDAAIGP